MIRMVCYDIGIDKARTKLAALLEYQGYERVQYSVFIGRISSERWEKSWKTLEEFHKNHCVETDNIYVHVIERDHFEKMAILGKDLDKSWILHEQNVFFF